MSLGVTLMFASTYFFVAPMFPPGPDVPVVLRLRQPLAGSVRPVKQMIAEASASNTPGALLLIVIVHVAVSPLAETVGLAQVFVFVVSGVGDTEGVIAKLLGVSPVESTRAFTVTVKTWALFTSLMSLGVTLMFASTYFFVASPEFPAR